VGTLRRSEIAPLTVADAEEFPRRAAESRGLVGHRPGAFQHRPRERASVQEDPSSLADMSASVGPAGILSSPLPVSDNVWNTRYIEAALDHLRATGFDVREEDVERLTPLIWEHIELHGRYAFPEDQLPAGTLRALRDPTVPEEPDL